MSRSLAACVLVLGACASVPADPDLIAAEDIELAPYAMHEACARLEVGDRLEYRFTSNQPTSFNLHYHEGRVVVMPLSRDGVREDAGIYPPPRAQDYCLMWEAGPAGAQLRIDARVRRAASFRLDER